MIIAIKFEKEAAEREPSRCFSLSLFHYQHWKGGCWEKTFEVISLSSTTLIPASSRLTWSPWSGQRQVSLQTSWESSPKQRSWWADVSNYHFHFPYHISNHFHFLFHLSHHSHFLFHLSNHSHFPFHLSHHSHFPNYFSHSSHFLSHLSKPKPPSPYKVWESRRTNQQPFKFHLYSHLPITLTFILILTGHHSNLPTYLRHQPCFPAQVQTLRKQNDQQQAELLELRGSMEKTLERSNRMKYRGCNHPTR